MDVPTLLIGESIAAGAEIEDRKIGMASDLTDVLILRVVCEHVVFAIAVGSEIDRAIEPLWIEIVAAAFGLWNLIDVVIAAAVDPNARIGAAAVVLPLRRRVAQ